MSNDRHLHSEDLTKVRIQVTTLGDLLLIATDRYADSPIVKDAGSADQWLFGGGLAYQF